MLDVGLIISVFKLEPKPDPGHFKGAKRHRKYTKQDHIAKLKRIAKRRAKKGYS